ncbi:hypothetical protein SO694_00030329 [Aureococcus anophagefferens]|uniref:Anoctamin transmembrane domain-containing protein n=1 Tax=Aureococcus anophagefferens TaxID=44056 RepID=A0ABR1FK08_AURAN
MEEEPSLFTNVEQAVEEAAPSDVELVDRSAAVDARDATRRRRALSADATRRDDALSSDAPARETEEAPLVGDGDRNLEEFYEAQVGLVTSSYLSIQKDEIFVRVGATHARLAEQADNIDFVMPLNEQRLEAIAAGNPARHIAPIDIPDKTPEKEGGAAISRFRAFEHMYGKFDTTHHLTPDYFGEKQALLMRFMGHVTNGYMGMALVGVVVQIRVFVATDSRPAVELAGVYSLILCLWSVFQTEYWKRTERETALLWGTVGFEDQELVRPQFKGIRMLDPVTGRRGVFFPPAKRSARVAASFFATFACNLAFLSVPRPM